MPDEKLVRKRASYKGQLTSFSTYISSLDASELDPLEVNELQIRVQRMETVFDRYDEVQLSIECNEDDMELQSSERNEFEKLYYKLMSQAKQLLDNSKKAESTAIEVGSHHSSIRNNQIKLPIIQLPKFSGSYDNWMEFHDTFSSLIHLNDDIDNINKFHYLRASLEGSAATVIQAIEFSSANYSVAWQLLCERYENKRLLIQNHVSALFNLETITKESSNNLKRLIDQTNKNLRSLECLGEPTKHWDTLLIYMITHKLDSKTFREWESYKSNYSRDEKITFNIFITFIKNRADLLETIEMSQNISTSKSHCKVKTLIAVSDKTNNNKQSCQSKSSCPKCKGDHKLINCPQFLALTIEQRLKVLPEYKVCYNCFNSGHYANVCKKPGCKVCRRKHNLLIHSSDSKPVLTSIPPSVDTIHSQNMQQPTLHPSASGANLSLSLSASMNELHHSDVLLSTALIRVFGKNHQQFIVRALLDSGSTSCLMSQSLYDKLQLPACSVQNSILGINNITSPIKKLCRVRLTSLDESYTNYIPCFVLPSVTHNVPSRFVDVSNIRIPSNIVLADPHFYVPAPVDILIGADIFWDVLGSQRLQLGKGQPILCETRLGWLVSGPIAGGQVSPLSVNCNYSNITDDRCSDWFNELQNQLSRFWQIEEVNVGSKHSPEEKSCEKHFLKTTTRLPDGRFCVRIPLKHSPELLGDSLSRAKQCFISLERKLSYKPIFSSMYKSFMSEYETLGHMTKCKNAISLPGAHFIPHHGIMRECSTTTKLRVVFNASSPTTTGVSFNQLQMVGPVVQDDLLSILLRFRQHKYVIAADVEKMYRQISVHPDDRYLQQIVWRNDPSEPLHVFQLNTVTYGTASAPYLATRCLKQLGLESTDKTVSEAIIHDFYVDDFLSGGDTLKEVIDLRDKVTCTLSSAQMHLRKWKSNEPQILTEYKSTQSSLDLNIGAAEPSKTLGLGWMPQSDNLYFPIGDIVTGGNTKREMLSIIAQIYDPLGLLAPCVIVMKISLQKLWLHKLAWDEQLSPEINKVWCNIITNLPLLNQIHVPRHVICDSDNPIELHIFTDASESAYGACLYVRSFSKDGDVMVRLLMAKSRVAPLKSTTIPRLELCGALIGTRLYEKAIASLRLQIARTIFWTDSTIVLGWLRMLPSKLQPFVRNRVADILDKAGNCEWRHVPTDDNPADYISRGVDIASIATLDKWWSGPAFLSQNSSLWPSRHVYKTDESLPELKLNVTLHGTVIDNKNYDNGLINFNRFSNFLRLNRAIAFMLRFINCCRKKRVTGHLQCEELQLALNLIIQTAQNESFSEYQLLLNNQDLPKKSPLLKFNVFLDVNKIMRVGGRLTNSNFEYNKKHPILLQSAHRFTKLLFNYEHKKLMHAGPQLLLASIRENYWPIGGRNLSRYCYRQCVTCCRMRGKTVSPIMGNLPQQRLLAGFPFDNVGLDYAGPIQSVSRQGRGCKVVKVYIAIFVCFSTKAIHLELVGDLTSTSFLMALRRFVSRRGKPSNIFADNGTTFVGAYNDISNFLKTHCNSLPEEMANDGINFHFIPAYSPHFAGLAEAGVKSTKHHLVRVLGCCHLTYEELSTTLIQIEAILNSRPLTPLSSDPEDTTPLTPGHFLIGRSLTSLPSQDLQNSSISSLTRFQRIEQLRQHFWARWSKEYISELQLRTKWRSSKGFALKLNSLVLLKDDNLPPLKWKLGRVVAVYPGADGVIRVADVKTSTGVLRRSFSKICPLPEYEEMG